MTFKKMVSVVIQIKILINKIVMLDYTFPHLQVSVLKALSPVTAVV